MDEPRTYAEDMKIRKIDMYGKPGLKPEFQSEAWTIPPGRYFIQRVRAPSDDAVGRDRYCIFNIWRWSGVTCNLLSAVSRDGIGSASSWRCASRTG